MIATNKIWYTIGVLAEMKANPGRSNELHDKRTYGASGANTIVR